jgi:uncharacterized phage protein gp47/JayE
MNLSREFDALLAAMLTDWQNQNPDADLSRGSLIYMKSACLASALWGIYKYQDWIARQIFPDTADTAQLEHHAWTRAITRLSGEADAALLARILDDIRRPPAGGNQYDYIKWALAIDGVARAYCVPLAQGLGTVDVIILADAAVTGSEIPSNSARIGAVTSVGANKLNDSGGTFEADHAVAAGDVVQNTLRGTRTTVASVDSGTQLTLAADIFAYVGEPYIIHCQTGTSTSVSAGRLVDSAGAFEDADYTVAPGDIVENVTDNLEATVVSVDSGTQLTLDADIFTATGKTYVVRGLVGRVKAYIDQQRPVTASLVSVVGPTVVDQDVTMTITGTGLDLSAIADSIEAYLDTLTPGQTLYLAKLTQIAMDAGADNAVISAPAADVAATTYQMLRAGTVSVT